MSPRGQRRNIGVSVRDRLTRSARSRTENVQLVLTRFAIERLLYRLSISRHRDRFVLKGAMLFSLWSPTPYRATGDLDLLGYGEAEPERMAETFREICGIETDDDGVAFQVESLRAELARAEEVYRGVRLTVTALIAGARIPIRVDVGFGDVVTPAALEVEYPSLLDLPRPRLRAYPPETVVAEKLQALVALGMVNSRMKDFFDLWALAGTMRFEGGALAEAIRRTFAQRATDLPTSAPRALTEEFTQDASKRTQWNAFIRRSEIALEQESLDTVTGLIGGFVMPPILALVSGEDFAAHWQPGGPWTEV
jgi:hypothetical protein